MLFFLAQLPSGLLGKVDYWPALSKCVKLNQRPFACKLWSFPNNTVWVLLPFGLNRSEEGREGVSGRGTPRKSRLLCIFRVFLIKSMHLFNLQDLCAMFSSLIAMRKQPFLEQFSHCIGSDSLGEGSQSPFCLFLRTIILNLWYTDF